MSLVKFCGTDGTPQDVNTTDGAVHTLLVGTDGTPQAVKW
jgi:hypothetical protein